VKPLIMHPFIFSCHVKGVVRRMGSSYSVIIRRLQEGILLILTASDTDVIIKRTSSSVRADQRNATQMSRTVAYSRLTLG
jgi:hypothetical protein